ncbi:MAG: hypothetical protein IEMM0002_0910 [bacterium]|nr:MAG: hypothetical protein IEMM0002_0910 [bacterium]
MDWNLLATIAAPVMAAVIGIALDRGFKKRPKLITYLGYISTFTLNDEQHTIVFTHSIIVRNIGGKSATNVRVGHNALPDNFNLFPNIPYEVKKTPGGGAEILIPILVPYEQITISYLYFPPMLVADINDYTKHDDGFAQIINVLPTPQPSQQLILIYKALVLLGLILLIYILLKSVIWAYSAIPA